MDETYGYRAIVMRLGPLAYWRLGESSGTFCKDEMLRFHGTYTNSPTLGVAGLAANDDDTAVDFEYSSNQYALIQDDPYLSFITGSPDAPFSLSFMIKMESTPSAGTKHTVICKDTEYTVEVDENGALMFALMDTSMTNTISYKTANSAVAVGTTEHWLVTYDGGGSNSGINIYRDGISVRSVAGTTGTYTAMQDGATSLYIGKNPVDSTSIFDGVIDELAIYASELAIEDARELYYIGVGKSELELLFFSKKPSMYYWPMSDVSGPTVTEEMAAVNGTAVNSPTFGSTEIVSGTGASISFDGATQGVRLGAATLDGILSGVGIYSVGLSFQADNLSQNHTLFCSYIENGSVGLHIRIPTASAKIEITARSVTTDTGQTYTSDNVLKAGFIYHIIAVIDIAGDAISLYVNGCLDKPAETVTFGNATYTSGTPTTDEDAFGFKDSGGSSSTEEFPGELSNIFLHIGTLTDEEVRYLWFTGLVNKGRGVGDWYYEIMRLCPIAFWRLGEEAATGTAYDEKGLHDMTTVTGTQGYAGFLVNDTDKAWNGWGGSTYYMYGPMNGNSLPTANKEKTALALVHSDNGTNVVHNIIGTRNNNYSIDNGNAGWTLNVGNSTISYRLQLLHDAGANKVANSTTSPSGAGRFVAASVLANGGSKKLYIDGRKEVLTVDTMGAATNENTAGSIAIGGEKFQKGYIRIDECTLFNRQLTDGEILRLWLVGKHGVTGGFTLAAGERTAIAHWPSDDADTGIVDALENSYDGTANGTPTFEASGIIGSVSLAVGYDGSTDYMSIADTADMDLLAGDKSFEVYIYPTSLAADFVIWSKYQDATNFYELKYINSTDILEFSCTVTSQIILIQSVSAVLAANQWHSIHVVLDRTTAGNCKIYVNALDRTSGTPTTSATSADFTGAVNIGRRGDASNYFPGTIDNPSVYNHALSADEVYANHYATLTFRAQAEETVPESSNVTDSTTAPDLATVVELATLSSALINELSLSVSESFSIVDDLGLAGRISDMLQFSGTASPVLHAVVTIVDAITSSHSESYEVAAGIVESIVSSGAWAGVINAMPIVQEQLTVSDALRLTWGLLASDALNVTDADNATLAAGAAIVELLVSTGLVATTERAVGVVADAFTLLDLIERKFELSAVDSATMAEVVVTTRRGIVESIESIISATAGSGVMNLSLLVSDEVAASDGIGLAFRLAGVIEEGVVLGGALTLPDGVYSAYVVNSENLALSEYSNYPFNSFGKIGSTYLGATDSNIYELDGADDAGTDIDAVVRTGLTTFGTHLYKRVPRAYLGYTSDGGLVLKTITTSNGSKLERWYELTPRTANAHIGARIKLGRGVKSTYWQFEIVNKNGADFDIDSLQLFPMVLSRRV